jgi:hypothetical protein
MGFGGHRKKELVELSQNLHPPPPQNAVALPRRVQRSELTGVSDIVIDDFVEKQITLDNRSQSSGAGGMGRLSFGESGESKGNRPRDISNSIKTGLTQPTKATKTGLTSLKTRLTASKMRPMASKLRLTASEISPQHRK